MIKTLTSWNQQQITPVCVINHGKILILKLTFGQNKTKPPLRRAVDVENEKNLELSIKIFKGVVMMV